MDGVYDGAKVPVSAGSEFLNTPAYKLSNPVTVAIITVIAAIWLHTAGIRVSSNKMFSLMSVSLVASVALVLCQAIAVISGINRK